MPNDQGNQNNSSSQTNSQPDSKDTKYIFVTGGVLSGLGKGLVSASISKLLQQKDYTLTPVKCDGYLNVDPGTMNPEEHGEVYVLADGTEVDMDFGHYERFLNIETRGEWNLTSGKIFNQVIQKEREGDYLGETVQMVPHVTNTIKDKIIQPEGAQDSDMIIVEIGGTVGDMENMLYLETQRQIQKQLPENQTYHVHVTLLPYLETVGEQKTKPTQHSVKELRETGLNPDMIVGRSTRELQKEVKEKISLFCDVKEQEVISNPDLKTIYEIPLKFQEQNVHNIISRKLDLNTKTPNLEEWKTQVKNLKNGKEIAKIAIAGKYTGMDDTYASIEEALKHAAAKQGGKVQIDYKDTSSPNYKPEQLEEYDAVIIPGGFGKRGIEGKIETARYCRTNNKPLLGICLGLQIMAIEYAQNQLGVEDATSAEFSDLDGHQTEIITKMESQKDIEKMGGSMRLGNYTARLENELENIFGEESVKERHRHRYELKPEFRDKLSRQGLKTQAENPKTGLCEMINLPNHSFYKGTQSHPEFKSSFNRPHPLFAKLIEKAQKQE